MLLARLLCIICGVLTMGHTWAHDDFVLAKAPAKKKYSVNQLKELIGQETKELFSQTTKLGKTLASVHEQIAQLEKKSLQAKKIEASVFQQAASIHGLSGKLNKELAFTQDHCSSLIESLVDDQPPFKKASKQDLTEALDALGSIRVSLEQTVHACQTWCSSAQQGANNSVAMQKTIGDVCTKLDHCVTTVASARATMNGKRCLKIA